MPNRAIRILYIDDDPALGRLVQKALIRHGHEVEHAADAEAGLARIAQGGIDVLILDHDLGTAEGFDVLAALQGQASAPSVVYVTAFSDIAIAVKALKAGAADYVPKTVGDEFLVLLTAAVEQAIEKTRLKREKDRAEEEVRKARDRAVMLLAEVNHRVANSLALASSLVRMQISAVTDMAAKAALAETQGRIGAIAALHRRLYTSEDVQIVDLSAYLGSLVGELRGPMAAVGHMPQIRLMLDEAEMKTDRAVWIGMITAELVTNALKYAYADGEGEVRVILRRGEDGCLLLAVEDDGIGWDGTGKPKGTGLGSRIINAMAKSLGTQIEYARGNPGTRVSLSIAQRRPAD